MTFATDTCAAACCWCSLRIASSEVVCCATRCASTAARTAERRGPYSRTRCRSCTTKAGWASGGRGGGRPCPAASIRATYRSAARRASLAPLASSARRRRFSTRASLSMLGQAHSSPMVRGATVW